MTLPADPRWACNRKKSYPTQKFAEKVCRKAREERGVSLHAYACFECGRYHVASGPKGQAA